MLALLGALGEEITGIHRQMTIDEVIAAPDCKLYRGKYGNRDCLLAQTGMGKERVEAATRFILRQFRVSAVISLGFAGALTAELRAGDIIVCSTLCYCNGRTHGGLEFESLSSDASLLALITRALGSSRIRLYYGSSVTVPQLLSNRESKEELSKISRAYIADMESYWVARIAFQEKIPFLAIRAVSDTCQESLPPFDRILAGDGSWLWGKTFSHLVLHPQDLFRLPGLYSSSRKARNSLTDCVAQILAGMS